MFLVLSLLSLNVPEYALAQKSKSSTNKTESVDGIDFTPDDDEGSQGPKLNDIERMEAFDDAISTLDKAKAAIEADGKNFSTQCLKAFGNKTFCSCIANNRPSGIDFVRYIAITITPKSNPTYHQLPKGTKALIDKTIKARDLCAK